jgi:hypothetical protein
MADLNPLLRPYSLKQILQYLLSRFSMEEILEFLRASGEQKIREEVYSILGKDLARHHREHGRHFPEKDLSSAVATLVELREPTENEAYRWLRSALLKITVSYKKGASGYEREILCWLRTDHPSHPASRHRSSAVIPWDDIPQEARAQLVRGSACEEFQLFPPSLPEH